MENHDNGGLVLRVCDGGVLAGGENSVYGVVDGIVVIFGVTFVVNAGAVGHGFWKMWMRHGERMSRLLCFQPGMSAVRS
jgi:hypothetical protein